MSDFPIYRRQVEVEQSAVPSNVIKARTSVLDTFTQRMDALDKSEREQEQSINKVRYQNMSLEASARAYGEHPDSLDEYRSSYRAALKDYPIPLARRAEYEAILLNSEARFFSPILLNKKHAQNDAERGELLSLADNLFRDGTFVLGGAIGPDAPNDDNYVGDRYLEALNALSATDQHGCTIVPPDTIAGKVDEYGLAALSALSSRDVAMMDDPLSSAAPYIDGQEYVADIKSSSGAIRLSSNELSTDAREQLRANIREAVIRTLAGRKGREEFLHGRSLVELPASWRGTVDQRHALDQWARVQMQSQPLSADNEGLHIDNMVMFSRKFSYIPEAYVELLSGNINGGNGDLALSASKLLNVALESGGGRIAKQFDDVTLLRGELLHGLVWDGGMSPQVAIDAVNSISNHPRSRDYTINLNNKLRTLTNARDRTNIYGNSVSADEYGADGLELYESLVREYYLTNGGDGKSARKVAQSRIDGIYSYPRYGAYRRSGWIFKTGGRKLKYQPGAYYGSEVEEHIDADIREHMLPSVRELGYGDISPDNYFLVANMLTVDAFNNTNSKRAPAWELWYKNSGGSSIQVTDRQGNIVVYRVNDQVVAPLAAPASSSSASASAQKHKKESALSNRAQRHSAHVQEMHERTGMSGIQQALYHTIMHGGLTD